MSAPALPAAMPLEHVATENREGYEFVNDEWREKHPPVRPYHDRKRCEFVDGEWKEKNVSSKSSNVGIRLASRLDSYVEKENLGFVFEGDCAYQIHPDEPNRLRKPDYSFIALGRFPNDIIPDGNLFIAPDLAVEIVSPSDEAVDLNNKVTEFLRAGVRLVWVVYPASRTVWVFRLNGTASWLIGDAELNGEDVVPGFSVLLPMIFANV